MGTNVEAFNLAVQRAGKRIPEEGIVKFHKSIHLRVLRSVGFKTPVDTGRLRSNWQSTLGAPNSREVLAGGGSASKSAINAAIFAKAVSVLSGLQPYGSSFIFNNVVYGKYVEEGTERMKGAFMLQRALSEVKGSLQPTTTTPTTSRPRGRSSGRPRRRSFRDRRGSRRNR